MKYFLTHKISLDQGHKDLYKYKINSSVAQMRKYQMVTSPHDLKPRKSIES